MVGCGIEKRETVSLAERADGRTMTSDQSLPLCWRLPLVIAGWRTSHWQKFSGRMFRGPFQQTCNIGASGASRINSARVSKAVDTRTCCGPTNCKTRLISDMTRLHWDWSFLMDRHSVNVILLTNPKTWIGVP